MISRSEAAIVCLYILRSLFSISLSQRREREVSHGGTFYIENLRLIKLRHFNWDERKRIYNKCYKSEVDLYIVYTI